MKVEVRVPSVGESVSTADIESWEKKTGDFIRRGELLVTLETDKASMEVPVEQEGRLEILRREGDTVSVNEVIALIDTSAQIDSSRKSREPLKGENNKKAKKQEVFEGLSDEKKLSTPNESAKEAFSHSVDSNQSNYKYLKFEKPLEDFSPAVRHLLAGKSLNLSQIAGTGQEETLKPASASTLNLSQIQGTGQAPAESPSNKNTLNLSQIQGTGRGGRLIKEDILRALESSSSVQEPASPELQREELSSSKLSQKDGSLSKFRQEAGSSLKKDKSRKESEPALPVLKEGQKTEPVTSKTSAAIPSFGLKEGQKREPMTRLRRVTAERLVQSQHNTATLSTFNEADLSRIIEIRKGYQQEFIKKYGFKLGFMSFFVKAVISALKKHPKINAFIEGGDIIYNDFQHIGIAVSTEKGLVAPVLFYAETLSLAQIEEKIIEYRDKALARRLRPDDLLGGTFTISNGGVFGSLLSTPILNPPQSGILGMHKIERRPVAVNEKIEIRPMMYLALSYDHRMVDGRESVGFLVKVKEGLEEPSRLLIDI